MVNTIADPEITVSKINSAMCSRKCQQLVIIGQSDVSIAMYYCALGPIEVRLKTTSKVDDDGRYIPGDPIRCDVCVTASGKKWNVHYE